MARVLQKLICDGEREREGFPFIDGRSLFNEQLYVSISFFVSRFRFSAAPTRRHSDAFGAGHPLARGRRRRRVLRARQGSPLAGVGPGHRPILRRPQRGQVKEGAGRQLVRAKFVSRAERQLAFSLLTNERTLLLLPLLVSGRDHFLLTRLQCSSSSTPSPSSSSTCACTCNAALNGRRFQMELAINFERKARFSCCIFFLQPE